MEDNVQAVGAATGIHAVHCQLWSHIASLACCSVCMPVLLHGLHTRESSTALHPLSPGIGDSTILTGALHR